MKHSAVAGEAVLEHVRIPVWEVVRISVVLHVPLETATPESFQKLSDFYHWIGGRRWIFTAFF